MSNDAPRRYLFCEYETLVALDFDQLEKVCERVFILLSDEIRAVPIALVQQLQKLGPAAKWVPVGQQPGVSLSHHLTFLLGRLHQKLPIGIEFAVLSEDAAFDPLIQFINEKGRPARRVRRGGQEALLEAQALDDPSAPPPVERARSLWLENDLVPAEADLSEKN